MVQINVYKIDENKVDEFLREISKKFELRKTIIKKRDINGIEGEVGLSLYICNIEDEKSIKWNWILNEFGENELKCTPNPKGILLIEKGDKQYAITFGLSYFIVDKFCNRDFAFKFARKCEYKEVKTTALSSPNSKKNKIINTYINYNNLEFDSGESFTKIKAKISIPEGFIIHNESIEIGNSIKFYIVENKLDNIIDLIIYIENVLDNEKDKVKIPVYSIVKDEEVIEYLNNRILYNFKNNPLSINLSEIDIIGANEIFNHNDTVFELSYSRKSKLVPELNYANLKQFANENNIDLDKKILDIKVISYVDGNAIRTDTIKNLIDYTDESEKCILVKGKWYKYNEDYLSYLEDSLREIDVIYDSKYDLSCKAYSVFLNKKYNEEKNESKYKSEEKDKNKIEQKIRKSIANIYYREKYYNIMLHEEFGFENFDRSTDNIGDAKIELMDLYRDKTMFAVKIGKNSGKLCYVVEQSLSALRAYRHNLIKNKPHIENVGIWIVLERANKLGNVDNKPDINELDMLILKNKLDSWKKEVRVLGYKPVIYLNYVIE